MFDWTSFGTGFAKAASENFAKEEEDARALGAANVKSMYENYASVVKENRTLSNDIKDKINVVKGFAPNATDDQLVALAQDRGILDMLSTRLKDKDFDPTGFNINDFVKVSNPSGSALAAEDRINQLFTIPSAVNDASRAFKSITPEGEVKESPGFLSYFDPVGLATRSGEKQAKISAEKTAAALGVPLEKLQGAMGYRRDVKPSGAEYDLVALKPGKTLEQSIDDGAVKLAAAKKKGDPKEIELAQANVDNLTTVKQSLSDPQQKWLNKVATLKGQQLNGTPQQKEAATKELDAIYAEEKRAEEAKQQPEQQRKNLIAQKEIDANSDDPKKAQAAIDWLLKEAGVQAKVAEAKQTKTQQRDNYIADLELKAKNGTPAEQETAKAKLIDMKKFDKLVEEAGQTDVQARANRLAALQTKADSGDVAAKNELLQIAAVDRAIAEVKQTDVEKLTNLKAQLISAVAAGDKGAETKLQAFFAVEKMEAEAKKGAAAQRADRIGQLQMDAAAGVPGAQAELNKALAVDDAAKKAEQEFLKGDAQKRTDRLAALKTQLDAGNTSVKAEYDAMVAVDIAVKVKEQEALQSDVSQRNDRIASYQTTITTSKDPAAVKAARTQLAKEMKLVAEEAKAKQVPTAASDKVPSLGALNSFVAVAVTHAVQNKHGNLKNDMAIVSRPNGDGTFYQDYDYVGDDPALRKQIADTKAAAAKKALSVYTDNNGKPLDRNVQAVMNVWTGSAAAPEKTETGAGGGKGLGSRAASNTTTTGSGDSTVVTVVDPTGTPHVFKGKDAASKAAGFKAAAGIK